MIETILTSIFVFIVVAIVIVYTLASIIIENRYDEFDD